MGRNSKARRAKAKVSPRKSVATSGAGAPDIPPPPDQPVEVNDGSFSRLVLQSELPVLIDFWAPWCAPCRAMVPALKELAKDRAGRLRVAKYNTEESSKMASQLKIRAIPSMLLYRNGELVARHSGVLTADALGRWIDMKLAGLG